MYDHLGRETKRIGRQKPNTFIANSIPLGNISSRGLYYDQNFTALLGAYRSLVYTFANRNATSVAQATLRLYLARGKGKSKSKIFPTETVDNQQKSYLKSNYSNLSVVRKAVDFDEVLDHPILDILNDVNNFMNGFDLWELTQLHQELTGNAYWYLVSDKIFGIPREIWLIPPDRMRVIPDKERFISGYEYTSPGFAKPIVFSEDKIIHFKMANPKNLFYGFAPLAAIIPEYNINEQMSKYENAVFSNNGRLEGAFETEESLDEDDFNRLKLEIQTVYTGVSNAGKTPLLDNGLSFKNYGLPPRDLAFPEGRQNIKEIICNGFGQTLGMYDKSSTRANADAALYQYAKATVQPRCTRNSGKLNEKLVPRYDDNLFLAADNVVPEDRRQLLLERTQYAKAGIQAINEIREEMRKAPYKGLDEPFMQMQNVPVSMILAGKTLKVASNPSSENPEQTKKILKEKIREILKESLNGNSS